MKVILNALLSTFTSSVDLNLILISATKPPPTWPTSGHVVFENVSMKYGPDDPYVLKNLNVQIKDGWKVIS